MVTSQCQLNDWKKDVHCYKKTSVKLSIAKGRFLLTLDLCAVQALGSELNLSLQHLKSAASRQ